MMRLLDAIQALGARCLGDTMTAFDRVETDSRTLGTGALFVALRGTRFDGHDFVAAAIAAGAAAALVDEAWAGGDEAANCTLPLLIVPDTRLALGALAAYWRARFDLPLIGVTGSNGKTTVKDMCASILRAHFEGDACDRDAARETVLATAGNLNNDIGLPLTLLALRDHHRAAVVEMGMNRPGEIAYLGGLARPTVALVNNAQRAHLEGLGGVVEVAVEKGAIYGGLGADGVAVVNADDPHADYWKGLNASRKVLRFGFSAGAEVHGHCELHGLLARVTIRHGKDSLDVQLQVPGAHNAANALAAAACCMAAGVPLEAVGLGLSRFAGTKGRLQRKPGPQGATILDDSYNANPDSVRAGIDVLAATPGRKILVLGDMGEVGESSAQVHDEVGGYAKSKGVDALLALGEMSAVAVRNFGEGGTHFKSPEALVATLEKLLDADTVVLVKGSRFMRMERVVDLLAAGQNTAPSKNGGSHAA
ncbi:MAG: UDP-N-acetylmuramoyl-tripeptide--D-alanyl-D-alanine ligase [Rhodocyclaceae bacterium]